MSAPASAGLPQIQFQKNLKFMSGTGAPGIQITGVMDKDVFEALAADAPFPPRQIELGNITLEASASRNIEFNGKNGKVVLQASGSAFAGLGVYLDPTKLMAALGLDDDIAPGMADLSLITDSYFLLLRWGYDLQGSAQGSIALGATGAVTFGLDGKKEGAFAVVRRFAKDSETGARTAVTEAANSWMLPSQVSSLADLEPGTWLLSEVDGSVAIKLAAQYGYDFNWVRALQTGGLSGDIGLRIQLGVAVALGFQADGKYAIIIGRESPKAAVQQVRLRLFKLSKKGWDFAFNAGATVEAVTPQMPKTFDDFISAVLGLHGAQIIKDLHALERWTDPNTPPTDLLAGLGVDYAKQFLQAVTGIDVEKEFQLGIDMLKKFLASWDNLDHRAASAIWSLVSQEGVLKRIADIARQIAQLNQDALAALLQQVLNQAGFPDLPESQWLESILSGGVLYAVQDSKAFDELKKAAQFTTDLLDGSTLQQVLENLKGQIDKRLDLDQIKNELNQEQFNNVDPWLKAKLAQFLGQTLDLNGLAKIQRAIHALLGMRQEFYRKALDALKRKYSASLAYTYQSNTTNTALVDVTFDFAQNPGAGDLLQRAARDGDLNNLLVQTIPGVTLNLGTLTHEVQRHSHLEVTLPYYQLDVDHINDALAKFTAVDSADGRLLLYDLDAQDTVTVLNRRNSTLAVGLHLPASTTGVVQHSMASARYSYSWKQAVRDMRRAQLQYQIKPYVQEYWPVTFSSVGDGQSSGSFDTWVSDLDKLIDQGQQNGTDNFGNSVISLELSLPPEAVAAWLRAPSDPKAFEYMEMSRHVQARLKELIPFYFFTDPANYKAVGASAGGPFALLVYSCIPPSTDISCDGDRLTLNTNGDIYRDWMDPDKRRAMIWSQETTVHLGAALDAIANRLRASPGLEGLVRYYGPDQIRIILSAADSPQLQSLLYTEAQIIRGARSAALALSGFANATGKKPTDAIRILASFGAQVTDTFNSRVKSVYGRDALRPLGTMLFIEAARSLDPTWAGKSPAALLGLTVLKPNVKFPPDGFPDETPPTQADVVVRQQIANLVA